MFPLFYFPVQPSPNRNEQEILPTEVPTSMPAPQHVRILTPEHINQQHEVRFQPVIPNNDNVSRSHLVNINNTTTDTVQLYSAPPPPPPPPPPERIPPNVNPFYEKQRRHIYSAPQETNARQHMSQFMNNPYMRPVAIVNGGGVTVQNQQVYMDQMRDLAIGIPPANNLICQSQSYSNNGNMEMRQQQRCKNVRQRAPPPSYTIATNRCQQPEYVKRDNLNYTCDFVCLFVFL